MKSMITSIIIGLILATSVYSQPVAANDIVTCESRHQRHQTCPIQSHGYVTLRRQTRSIWVDENCKGEFEVETRHHTSGHSDHNGEKAVAAAAAIAIIAAVAASSKDDKHSRYNNDEYHGSRHSSYVPHWMVGDFEGYNMGHDAEVTMHISDDGRMTGRVDGVTLVGDSSNQVHYVRR
jgi:hypothetical protein